MTESKILMKYDGLDADDHLVDMRLLGRSMQGYERIISDGIILFLERRVPKRGERAILKVKARSPREGSEIIDAIVATSPGTLPLAWQILMDGTSNFVWKWVSFVLNYFGGRKKDAEMDLKDILDFIKSNSIDERAERQGRDEAWLAHEAVWRDRLFEVVGKLLPSAAHAVAPVGPSVSSVGFSAGSSPLMTVDVPMADAIRERGELEISDMQSMVLMTEGFRAHDRKLFVGNPEGDGFIGAIVSDPLFLEDGNPYIVAAAKKAGISVKAKTGRRDGKLERIYILDFEREL